MRDVVELERRHGPPRGEHRLGHALVLLVIVAELVDRDRAARARARRHRRERDAEARVERRRGDVDAGVADDAGRQRTLSAMARDDVGRVVSDAALAALPGGIHSVLFLTIFVDFFFG
jgi:hypothetical protein